MHASQQIRVDLVLRMLLTDVGPWSHTCQTQLSHQLLYLFSIEYISVGDKVLLDFTTAIKHVQGVFLIDLIQNFRLLLVWYGTPRRQIDCRAMFQANEYCSQRAEEFIRRSTLFSHSPGNS